MKHTTTTVTDSGAVWRLRAWNDPALESIWQQDGIICMSADEMGGGIDVWPGMEEMKRKLTPAFPGRSAKAIRTFVRYWDYFRRQMAPGDLVLVPLTARQVGVVRVVGDYTYDPERDPRLRHRRRGEWLRTMDRSALRSDIKAIVNAPGTICQVKAPGAYGSLRWADR